jgi:putative phosphoesterase
LKIAIISDIHGNYEALKVVLKEAKIQGVEHLLVLGDIVGYYYHPDKVLDAISEWSYDLIKGNHEYILENIIENPSISEAIRSKYGSGHQEAIDKLSAEQLNLLNVLPETKVVEFDKISILMSHGSPWQNDFYIYPDCNKETIVKCNSKKHNFVLIGHSHYAFAFKTTNSILINPGSVGQSRQTGGRAFWALINTKNECFQMFSKEYDTKGLLDEIKKKDPDISYLSNILRRE